MPRLLSVSLAVLFAAFAGQSAKAATPAWVSRADYASLAELVQHLPVGHSVVYVPPGRWVERQRVVIPNSKLVTLVGDGSDRSVLSFSVPAGSVGGLRIELTQSYERGMEVRGVGLETSNADAGSVALEVVGAYAGSSPFGSLTVEDLAIRPSRSASGSFWGTGLLLRDVWNGKLNGYLFTGPEGTTTKSLIGLHVAGSSVDTHIVNYTASNVRHAVYVDPNGVSEGIKITNATWNRVETGFESVVVPGQHGMAGLHLEHIDIDAMATGIRLGRIHRNEMLGIHIRKHPASNKDFTGIVADGCGYLKVEASDIRRDAGTSNNIERGIVVTGGHFAMVMANVLENLDTGVSFSGTEQATALANRGVGTTRLVSDAGSRSLIISNIP